MPRVRLIDVAREAGVSVGAASDALSGKNRIPEDTRRKVREAADRLGYVPNPVARAMTGGRLPLIALVITTLRREVEYLAFRSYWAEIIGTAALEFNQRGYGIVVLPGLQGSVAGLPYAGAVLIDLVEGDTDLTQAFALGIPLASDAMIDDPRVTIGLDVAYGASVPSVMEHFAASDCRRPAMIIPDIDSEFTGSMTERYAQWCSSHSVAPLAVTARTSAEELRTAISQLLDAGADAIYSAMPPEPFLGLLEEELGARGRKIGPGLRLVIQDEDSNGALAERGISTVYFSSTQFISEVAARLADAIEASQPQRSRISSPFDLRVHASSR